MSNEQTCSAPCHVWDGYADVGDRCRCRQLVIVRTVRTSPQRGWGIQEWQVEEVRDGE